MLSLSSLIEFLLDMLRDPATQNDFARDPNAALAARGLSGVTAQDVRDVQPLLADHTGVSPATGGAHAARSLVAERPSVHHADHSGDHYGDHYAAHASPVPAIQHVTHAYEVDHSTVVRNVTQEYKQYTTYKSYITDNSVHAENGGTVIQDSFNQDNDGIDLKGADLHDSVVAGGNADGSGNDVESTTNQGSYNDDHSTTTTDAHNQTSSEDHTDVGDGSHDGDSSHQSFSGSSIHDSYAVDEPSAAHADAGDEAGAHHVA